LKINAEIRTFCNETLLPEDVRSVEQRTVQSLIEANIKRKDKKSVQLKKISSLNVPKDYHTLYVREATSEAAVKTVTSFISKKRTEIDEAQNFDFFKVLSFLWKQSILEYIQSSC
jgi:hypothetical protein